jgi:DNA-directed RNA polymerase subunit L
MKIEYEQKKANELKIEVEGEGHSLLNLLQKTILEDETVEMAGYDVPHPLIDRAILYIRAKKKQKPQKVVKEAARKVHDLNKEFKKSFKKAIRDWKPK